MSLFRRTWLAGLVAVWPARVRAEDPASGSADEQRLRNRIDLWHGFASRTRSLVARYVCTRHSSLLYEPLVTTGGLVFVAPDRLVLRDDGIGATVTRIGADRAAIEVSVGQARVETAVDPRRQPAAAWLAARLLAAFRPGIAADLLGDARVHVPRRGHALELAPPRGSAARRFVRSLVLRFDPVGGAVLEIEITEAQGDRVLLKLADHRQNPDDAELERLLAGK